MLNNKDYPIFYTLKEDNIELKHEILFLTYSNSFKVLIESLNCRESFGRQSSNKTFEEVYKLFDSSSDFVFIIKYDFLTEEVILETGFSAKDKENKDIEYFVFIYSSIELAEFLIREYDLKEL